MAKFYKAHPVSKYQNENMSIMFYIGQVEENGLTGTKTCNILCNFYFS